MQSFWKRTKSWLVAITATMLGVGASHAQGVVKTEHASASLIAERSAVVPGDTFLGALKLDLQDDWHVYWKNPGDSGLPPTVEWKQAEGITTGPFRYPVPHAIKLATLMNYGYEHQLVLPLEFKIPATLKPGDTLTIAGRFDWLICADVCVPEFADLSLSIPVAASPETSQAGSQDIGAALARVPTPLTGKSVIERTAKGFKVAAIDPGLAAAAQTAKDIRFFPEGPEIIHVAPQKVRAGADGVSIELIASDYAKPGDQPLPGIIVVETADGEHKGWEVAPDPGAIPAAGVAEREVTGSSGSGGATSDAAPLDFVGLLTTLGLAFLGGIVLNLMPCVLPVLTIKAASLVHVAHDPKESRAHGLAYLGGVLVCFAIIGAILLALKAVGDTPALGFQLQYSWVTAFFALVMFAVGLNLLGVFEIGGSLMGVGSGLAGKGGTTGAFFTGLLAAFVGAPCVGPFMAPAVGVALSQPPIVVMGVFLMIGVGLAAPFVALSFTPAVAKVLPKPGKWMATFRQALAFPMFLTALWLLWVLAGQSGPDGVIAVMAGAVALAFGIWLAEKIGKGMIGRVIAAAVILAAFVVPSLATTWYRAEAAAVTATTWSPEKLAELRGQNRVIFVDFTARWCITCQVNKNAINDAAVQKTFADLGVVFLEADWTNKDSVIAEALAEHGRAGVPLYLVYPASGGDPVILDQLLTAEMIQKAVREAAGSV